MGILRGLSLGFIFWGILSQTASAEQEYRIAKWVSPESQAKMEKLQGDEKEALRMTLGWIDDQWREFPSRLKPETKKFYLTCDPVGGQALVGYKYDSCAAIEVAPNQRVIFKKISIHQIEAGVGVEIDAGPDLDGRLTSTMELRGLNSIEDVPGTYLALVTSLGVCTGGEMNWVMKKLTGSGYAWLDPRQDKTGLEANWLSVQLSVITGTEAPSQIFFLRLP